MNIIKALFASAAVLPVSLLAEDINVTPHQIPGKVKADFNVLCNPIGRKPSEDYFASSA